MGNLGEGLKALGPNLGSLPALLAFRYQAWIERQQFECIGFFLRYGKSGCHCRMAWLVLLCRRLLDRTANFLVRERRPAQTAELTQPEESLFTVRARS